MSAEPSAAQVDDLPPAVPPAGEDDRPNVLVIVTDDQRPSYTMQAMPKTMRWFGRGGTRFTNAYATTPLCCPSRASIFTGRFAHNHRVRSGVGAADLDQRSTVQRYLQASGYRTAIVGKYLNGWPVSRVPPYFDRYAIMRAGYYDATWNTDGTVETLPDYSTTYIKERALEYIDAFERVGNAPWFIYLAPYAPHKPWEPEDRYKSTDVGTWAGNPAVFERDRSDKPPYVQRSNVTYAEGKRIRRQQLRTLLSVDDLVDETLTDLKNRGELENTIAFFLSDNGFLWGEHKLRGKFKPYTASIGIPYFLRWPGRVPAGRLDRRPTANIDIVPTILHAAGVAADPAYPIDGRSLLRRRTTKKMLTEMFGSKSWSSVRTPGYQYIELFSDGRLRFREYYNLGRDRWQLRNLLGDGRPGNDPYVGALSRELRPLRRCAGRRCVRLLNQSPVPMRCPEARRARGRHLVGSNRSDRIVGWRRTDVICGRRGGDSLFGQDGDDRLYGGPGRDRLDGGRGADLLIGGTGHDVCIGDRNDRFRGCEVRRRG